MQETEIQFRKIPLEKETATHSNILAWRIPGTEKPLVARVGHVLVTVTMMI